MAHWNGQSNGERSWSTDSRSVRVTRGEDGQYKDHGDEHLNAERLRQWVAEWRLRGTDYVDWTGCSRSQAFENSSASDSTHRLHHDVQKRSAFEKHTTDMECTSRKDDIASTVNCGQTFD